MSDETFAEENTDAGRQGMPMTEHLRQTICVFKLQMRLYSKSISTYIVILLALMIPILVYSGALNKLSEYFGFELNAAYVLALMPLMIVAIPAKFSGRIMSSEFKNRTAFVNFPLPMSRITFYMGKFLAALVMSSAIMLLAIGTAAVSSSSELGMSYPSDIVSMAVVSISGMIALLAMTYCLGTIFSRGAGIISIIITLAVPFVTLSLLPSNSAVWNALDVTPFFLSYKALWFIDNGFVMDIIDIFARGGHSAYILAAVSAAWCALFLLMGAFITKQKEI